MDLAWMAWTEPTAYFFMIIATMLVVMTIWAILKPEQPRVGILKIETTRGDRLFIGLLGSAFICLIWLSMFGSPLWWALVFCACFMLSVFKWV